MSLRLLLLSTPVGPLGSGLGGGVEATVLNLAQVLTQRGHRVAIAAPEGSQLPSDLDKAIALIQIPGVWQPTAQTQDRNALVLTESALANLWDYARRVQNQYDLLANFAYDWLPFYLTPFLSTPVAHFVSMGSLSVGEASPLENRLDQAIVHLSAQFPGTLGAYTQSQVKTFQGVDSADWEILGCGLDMARYEYCDRPKDFLAWAGRISPEKGLEDAISAALLAQKPLKIFGNIEDDDYWQSLQPLMLQAQKIAPIQHCGFLPTAELQQALGRAQALLVTPKWTEAFGIVAIEALACGVPVIAYKRGGPAEIVCSGKTGWLVAPDDVRALAEATERLQQIDRQACREWAIANYSLSAWGERFEQWFCKIVAKSKKHS
ncbi:MAG: UDP-glucose--tetrahydrobiopterin glucosyltransferase [Leptolyngbya foveolarum]|uniref:UDP-glucose--tetrahydrobiopterin glucosyltransferase n=1 Tax=Leptolyngbya foveolarum TaxID=47253 RepID=A0A2W4UP85_9CYAN|nr:MAG: UDP-glucose--tetrahydrobiopterin glucosyltransferase [Leptolyngbya foveolarum]